MKLKTDTAVNPTDILFPFAIVNQEGFIIQQSKSFASFFESPRPIGKLQEMTDTSIEATLKGLREQKSFHQIIAISTQMWQRRWVRFDFIPHDNKEKFFQLSVFDVTKEKLHHDLAQQASIIARVGSWMVDLEHNTVIWCEFTKEIHEVPTDYKPDLEGGINYYKSGVHRENIVKAVSECIETGKPFDLELIIVTAKGNEKWVRSMGQAERVNGKTVKFSGTFQDIDDRKRQQLAYEELNNRMRIAINSANIGVWDFDITNNILIWDDKMYELYGVQKEDFNGGFEAWEKTIHPEDKEKANLEVQKAIEGKKELNTEFRVIKNDGTIAFIHAEAKVFLDGDDKPFRMIGANTDLTRIKKQDERLRNLLNITEKQNQRLLQFTNIVSHNLRSNSSNISMLSGMLNTKLPAEHQSKFLEMIQTSSEQLDDTIVQLNEIVKIQATDKNDMQLLALRPILDNVVQSLNGLVLESGAQLSIGFDNHIKVNGVKAFLTSIFLNLLTNSIKYRKPKKPLKIEINAECFKDEIVISFRDNGLGIDLVKHGSKLFGMYKTFHNHKDAKGIGLFITKNQMEAMGGMIKVESHLNKGATFYLHFTKRST